MSKCEGKILAVQINSRINVCVCDEARERNRGVAYVGLARAEVRSLARTREPAHRGIGRRALLLTELLAALELSHQKRKLGRCELGLAQALVGARKLVNVVSNHLFLSVEALQQTSCTHERKHVQRNVHAGDCEIKFGTRHFEC